MCDSSTLYYGMSSHFSDIADPWVTTPSEPPPSYDKVTSPAKNDPWSALGTTSSTSSTSTTAVSGQAGRTDPFAADSDPFSVGGSGLASVTVGGSSDPFQPISTE